MCAIFGETWQRRAQREGQAAYDAVIAWQVPPAPPDPATVPDWCAACEQIVPTSEMGWSTDGLWLCGPCRGEIAPVHRRPHDWGSSERLRG